MDRRALFLLVFALLSGCVEQGTLPAAQDEDVQPSYVPELPKPAPHQAPQEPFWATNRTGDLVLRLGFSVPSETDCNLSLGARSQPHSPGLKFYTVIKTPEGTSRGTGTFANAAQAHVFETVDTRDEVRGGITMEGRYQFREFKGPIEVFFAVRELGSSFNGEWYFLKGHKDASFYIGLSCDGVEATDLVEAGTELLLVDAETMDGGVGASAWLAGAVAHEDSAEKSFGRSKVFVQGYAYGHKGTLQTTHAEGQDAWSFEPGGESEREFWTKAGRVRFDLTTVGLLSEVFTVCAAGLDSAESLEALEEALATDPPVSA